MRFRLVGASGWAWKVAIPVACLAAAGQLAFAGTASARTTALVQHPVASTHNLLDCNITLMKGLCTDPHGFYDGKASRFRDPLSGAYVGHDEPSVKFISGAAGSAFQMNYGMQLPMDPATAPTASGSVTKYGELSLAPWFGLPICDPKSYPENPCKNLSDTNSGSMSDPNAAGSAFLEVQFYPPGFPPFADSTSCSSTQWCVALTIDSLECTFQNFTTGCNPNCTEPVNFSYLQTNGVPAGPPSPLKVDNASYLGNSSTLKMNPGDVLKVSIRNVPDSGSPDIGGLKASVTDVTTGKTGFVVASAKNGFQNTSITNCAGTPFSFHAEYNSAKQQNQVPWAALEGGVLMEQEMGHGESCSSVSNKLGISVSYSDGTFSDPSTFQTCNGGLEGSSSTSKGEGPCNLTTGSCSNSTTQGTKGPVACPNSTAPCEYADGICIPKGNRTVKLGNHGSATESSPVAICNQNYFQNGDLDFDGLGYRADWPNGSSSFPTSIRYIGPFTGSSPITYKSIQFETDSGGSQNLCNISTGTSCTAPPISAKFYPFWSMTNTQGISGLTSSGNCVWNFGNDISGVTTNDFGKDKQYGTPDIARYGGTLTSTVMANPETGTGCTALTGF